MSALPPPVASTPPGNIPLTAALRHGIRHTSGGHFQHDWKGPHGQPESEPIEGLHTLWKWGGDLVNYTFEFNHEGTGRVLVICPDGLRKTHKLADGDTLWFEPGGKLTYEKRNGARA